MELAQEEFMLTNDPTQILKGKRTKRQRSSSPSKVAGAAVVSTSSSGCGDGEEDYGSISSHTSNNIHDESTEEEEDMANCLILLAQGDAKREISSGITCRVSSDLHERRNDLCTHKFNSRKFSQISTTTNKAGFFVYECKTCNRSFPSFQALGGHRASHKKPKSDEKKAPSPPPPLMASSSLNDRHDDNNMVIHHHNLEETCQLNKSSTSSSTLEDDHHQHHDIHHHHHRQGLSLQISKSGFMVNNKGKMHECSICGSEFTSGQALGGHMRRHRAANNNNNSNNHNNQIICSDEKIKPRNILSLDLNLPAPEDDQKFQFVPTKQALMFSATPALVDCHY